MKIICQDQFKIKAKRQRLRLLVKDQRFLMEESKIILKNLGITICKEIKSGKNRLKDQRFLMEVGKIIQFFFFE